MALLDEIAKFISRHQLSERRFGELALNDKNFVSDVRAGRSPSLNTVDKLRAFMAEHDRAAA